MEPSTILLVVAAVIGLYMAWNIGANDVANAMGTSVGSGALTLRNAIIAAAIFEFGGALLVGGTVTDTIRKGIVDIDAIGGDPTLFAVGMTCCLLAAAAWLNIATYFGWPVSTTHSIVGAVVGFGVIAGGFGAVDWLMMGKIVASWVVSPALGGLTGYLFFLFIKKNVLAADDPLGRMRKLGPFLVVPIVFVLALAMMFKGLKPLKLDLEFGPAAGYAAIAGVVFAVLSVPLFNKMTQGSEGLGMQESLARTEKVFIPLQILTACFVAFAHGSNDVANAVGPLAAVFGTVNDGVTDSVSVPIEILLVGAVGIVVGLATYGYKVMGTVGEKITELTPSRGFTAELAAAGTIVLASKMGLPVSTTHTLVGAVVGVGFARSIGAIDVGVLKGIVASWFVTVPVAAVFTAVLYFFARMLV